ncbi:hypothetical protein K3495_g591 [Podosphaera aphanis]|nr:hypothetical protein K3495_g591 [Podosphaera aphanis]
MDFTGFSPLLHHEPGIPVSLPTTISTWPTSISPFSHVLTGVCARSVSPHPRGYYIELSLPVWSHSAITGLPRKLSLWVWCHSAIKGLPRRFSLRYGAPPAGIVTGLTAKTPYGTHCINHLRDSLGDEHSKEMEMTDDHFQQFQPGRPVFLPFPTA